MTDKIQPANETGYDDLYIEAYCEECDIKQIIPFEDSHNYSCEKCGTRVILSVPTQIKWCDHCNIPIISKKDHNEINECKICNNSLKKISTDIRPVFPEERLLMEIIIGKPLEYIDKSVWYSNSRYIVNGEKIAITLKTYENLQINKEKTAAIRAELKKYSDQNNDKAFKHYIDLFMQANKERHVLLKHEAYTFISRVVKDYNYDISQILVSFSGGKDSTVIADLVSKALTSTDIKHIYGDTTLEFPTTAEYVNRFRKNNSKTIMSTAKNREMNFLEQCNVIGPPSRVMRWCCHTFKTGPISRKIDHMFKNTKILTFYGIRASESESRSKYERVYDSPKISRQKVASPIFDWKDIDVWLHILRENIDFNDAYKLGFSRVGCWCCPNNNIRAEFIANLYSPDLFEEWNNYLLDFSKKIGKADYDVYVKEGKWKARQGGYGIEAADDVILTAEECTKEEDALIYRLNAATTPEFYSMFIPLGIVREDLGRKLLDERIILHPNKHYPLFSIQPYRGGNHKYAVKVIVLDKTLKTDSQKSKLIMKIEYQIRKFNGCKNCLACEALCQFRAITIRGSHYIIDEKKCKRCGVCTNPKYLDRGCMMSKYLFKAEKKV